MIRLRAIWLPLLVLGAAMLVPDLAAAAADAAHGAADAHGAEHSPLGARLPLWSVGPFAGILLSIAGILLSIALFPLVVPAFWHHHYDGKVSAGCAVLFGVPFLLNDRQEAIDATLHIYAVDYIPFIILLWALFTIAGGVGARGSLFSTVLGGLDMSAAESAATATCGEPEKVAMLIAERNRTLLSIEAGAVFMGANTYIGNAPNFMVKAIAEEGGVAMGGADRRREDEARSRCNADLTSDGVLF